MRQVLRSPGDSRASSFGGLRRESPFHLHGAVHQSTDCRENAFGNDIQNVEVSLIRLGGRAILI